jgi:hypothetical protein
MTLAVYQAMEAILPTEVCNNIAQLMINKLIESTAKEYGMSAKRKVLFDLYAYRKQLAELFQAISSDFNLLVHYYDVLVAEYYSHYIQSYQKKIESTIDSRTRKQYQTAAELLLSLQTIYLDYVSATEWQSYLQNLKARYPKLPALHDELKRAGL